MRCHERLLWSTKNIFYIEKQIAPTNFSSRKWDSMDKSDQINPANNTWPPTFLVHWCIACIIILPHDYHSVVLGSDFQLSVRRKTSATTIVLLWPFCAIKLINLKGFHPKKHICLTFLSHFHSGNFFPPHVFWHELLCNVLYEFITGFINRDSSIFCTNEKRLVSLNMIIRNRLLLFGDDSLIQILCCFNWSRL